MKTTIKINSIFGKLLFEFEKEENTIKDTLIEAVKSRADLSRADLSGADLSGADLSRAYLSRADLSGAYLSGAYLSGANLSGAYLSRADLSGAYLSGAKIEGKEISKIITIQGTKHSVVWYGLDVIHIGCHKKEISWWVKNFKMIGEKEGYSPDEIEEYHQYILICRKLQKMIK